MNFRVELNGGGLVVAFWAFTVAIAIAAFIAASVGGFIVVRWLGGPASSPKPATASEKAKVLRVGFALDDTLLFTSGLHTPYYNKVNGRFDYLKINADTCSPRAGTLIPNDRVGVQVKPVGAQLVKQHLRLKNEVYVVTARQADGEDALRKCVKELFDIREENVFFADSKAAEIKRLGLHIYYGDSDFDMADALAAGAQPVRVLRSCFSLRRGEYHPGLYAEPVIRSNTLHEVTVLPDLGSLVPSLDEAMKRPTEHDLTPTDNKAINDYLKRLQSLTATTPCPKTVISG